MRLLANQSRLSIVATLIADGELSVGDIADKLQRPLPAISQHLTKLRQGNLVTSRSVGTTRLYRISGTHIRRLVENLLHHTEHEFFTHPPHHA